MLVGNVDGRTPGVSVSALGCCRERTVALRRIRRRREQPVDVVDLVEVLDPGLDHRARPRSLGTDEPTSPTVSSPTASSPGSQLRVVAGDDVEEHVDMAR